MHCYLSENQYTRIFADCPGFDFHLIMTIFFKLCYKIFLMQIDKSVCLTHPIFCHKRETKKFQLNFLSDILSRIF